ncbi:MAG: hypothetical protein H0U92_12865 [Actinobacteria bacterium]|nr:hypothetical protein [Actinomycetota bacterium]
MRRPKALIAAVVVIALVIVAVLAVKSRSSDNKPLSTSNREVNCSPLARADAVATKPGEPIAVDVLANDTDPESDPLVFQILETEGGTSAVDDGGTPTDSGDDRLLFTPADPPVDGATIEYEARDPQGGSTSSTVVVYVNPTATLPDGVKSEASTDPVPEGTGDARCGGPTSSTVVEDTTDGTVGDDAAVDTATTTVTRSTTNTTTSSSRRRTTTTRKGSNATTTTAKKTATTRATSPSPTDPPSQPTTTRRPTTTRPPSSGTTRPNRCGDPNPGSPNYNPNFRECAQGTTTTAP